ncbi:alpha/beta fold hydrolase [Bacillus sp. FJAT-28004]|uniref:alpha/beta fold hydrolase n=1 Tax=Bacillus sp. FJAT-28004 TaxID=1679165 RepID=UPI0006B52128|nr:alpha/beta hydrolase [Bacillus sp. FJAT-28004]
MEIDAHGRQLRYMEKGAGKLTVVFESGMGLSRSTWGLVQPLVAEHARVIVYDRTGIGRSEPGLMPRTLARMADDLAYLLNQRIGGLDLRFTNPIGKRRPH